MAAKSEQDANKARSGLPFDPKGKKPSKGKLEGGNSSQAVDSTASKSSKKAKQPGSDVSARAQAKADEILSGNSAKPKKQTAQKKAKDQRNRANNSGAIPKEVSDRMLRRMAVLSSSPVFLGVGIFFLAYYLKSREIVEFPPVAVLLVTMGCFGLGVLGLTYGVLSASWDAEPGSLIGLSEFKLNFGRVMDARKTSKT
ncbi:MAG: DUF3464 domain-containing protein [Phormidesmis priestleyi]|uniref:DUF3464 domain-containing protein n=1 Tax=Phormidesmis priestleyi TaxID=268141 RepID=A0A2W4WK10_9CYAN|nr:MAG: DUF3464 domain-containing protein [Phormidesmis priestleyi]